MKTKLTNLLTCLFWFALLLVFVAGLSKVIGELNRSPKWKDAAFQHNISEAKTRFELLWSLSDVFASYQRDGATYLIAEEEDVFLLGSLDQTSYESLIKLNAETGQVI